MQKVSDRQDTEEKPPPGGRVVTAWVQPGTVGGGTGTVVATPEGFVVVVVEVVAGMVGNFAGDAFPARPGADEPWEHPHRSTASTATHRGTTSRLVATNLPYLGRRSPPALVVVQG
jgi:hypothetical protein